MWEVPDAPYISAAERYGTDYMYEYAYGSCEEEEEDEYAEEV